MEYSSGLVSESFWFVEVKNMIFLLDEGISWEELKKKCVYEHFFGTQKEYRANRIFGYLKRRISLIDDELWKLFLTEQVSSQKIINLVAIFKGNPLYFEFLHEIYKEKLVLGDMELKKRDINRFFSGKQAQDQIVSGWKDVTLHRLGSNYCNFLVDAGLLIGVDGKKTIVPPVFSCGLDEYLKNREYPMWKAMNGVV